MLHITNNDIATQPSPEHLSHVKSVSGGSFYQTKAGKDDVEGAVVSQLPTQQSAWSQLPTSQIRQHSTWHCWLTDTDYYNYSTRIKTKRESCRGLPRLTSLRYSRGCAQLSATKSASTAAPRIPPGLL